MALKHILIHLDKTPHCEKRERLALALAARYGAHVSAVFAQADTDAPMEGLTTAPGARVPEGAEAAVERLQQAAEGRGLTVDTRIIPAASYSQLTKHLAYAVRDSDLAVLGQHDPDHTRGELPEDLVEQVVLRAGRPALVVPYAGEFEHIGERVLIGWNGTREASRALNDALPLMREAEAVRLLSINPPKEILEHQEAYNASVVRHLQVHGVEAEVVPEPNQNVGVADLLVSRLVDHGSDLLVMGAHGHYGVPSILRGGVTRDLLRQITVPTLLSH